jgi:hypothetical protein
VLIRRKGVSTFRFLNLVGTGNLNLKNNIMEKFTKEELETVGKFMDEYMYYSPPISLSDYLDQCKKPKTKKIVVEIEYNDSEFGISDKAIQEAISNFDTRNEYVTKVTELPETFTREDMIKFKYGMVNDANSIFWHYQIENFLSERNK